MHSVLLAQQSHFSTLLYSVGDVIASFEEVAAGDLEHVWEQLPLQLSDVIASFDEEVAAGDLEHV
jgi:hypothetical protein